MRLFKFFCYALLASQSVMQVQAHIEQTLLTTISYNPRTQRMEVIHQIYAHDIEHAFGNAVQADGGLDSIPAQANVGIELSKAFKLWNADGDEIHLALVGAELEAEFFYIYQEADVASIPETMRVAHNVLRNYWPDMQNYLNIDYGDSISSLIFSSSDGVKTIGKE